MKHELKNIKVPELRFSEFDGEWDIDKVGELCDYIVPGRNKPKIFDGDIPWITTPDITNNGIISKSKNGLAISKEEAKRVGAKIVPKDSIIMSCVGELGIVAKVINDLIINQQLHAFIPRKKLNNWFLLYKLSISKRYMEKVATKTAVPYMNKDNCNSIPIKYPSLPEQTKIATFLTSVDKRITLLQKKKTELEQYKKGVMQKLFSQTLRFKPALSGVEGQEDTSTSLSTGGSDFPDWEVKTLGDLFEFSRGLGLSKKNISENGLNKCIHYGELFTVYSEKIETVISRTNIDGNKSKSGDVLMPSSDVTPTGLATASVLLEDDVILGGDINVLRPQSKVDSLYISYLLNFSKKQIIKLVTGTTVKHIYNKDVKQLKFNLPKDKEEQQKTANFLSSIDQSIENISNQIEDSVAFKKGLLQKLFV